MGSRHGDWEFGFWTLEFFKVVAAAVLFGSILYRFVNDADLKYFTISEMHAKNYPVQTYILAFVCWVVAFCSFIQFIISHYHKGSLPKLKNKKCWLFHCSWVKWRLTMEILSDISLIIVGFVPMFGEYYHDLIHCGFAMGALSFKLLEHHFIMGTIMFFGLVCFVGSEIYRNIFYLDLPSPLKHSQEINIFIFLSEIFVLVFLAFRQSLDCCCQWIRYPETSLESYVDTHHDVDRLFINK
jgi:hypothetical protein